EELGGEDDVDSGAEEDMLDVDKLEGYDYETERKILLEEEQALKRAKKLNNLRKLQKHKLRNAFDNLLETKELDGLTSGPPNTDRTYDPQDPNLLVEWSVPERDRCTAIS